MRGSAGNARPEGNFSRLPEAARAVARATLYEGYVLWPYRRSAPKNQRRWTFGGVHPRDWSEPEHADDAWRMRAECLVRLPGNADDDTGNRDGSPGVDRPATVQVGVGFLQVVERRVARVRGGRLAFADEIEVGGDRVVAWEEAREREFVLPPLPLADGAEQRRQVVIHAASEPEWMTDDDGERAGAIVRSWRSLAGELCVRCHACVGLDEADDPVAFRVSAEISNTTPWEGEDRADALRSTFASTHLVFGTSGGEFVSLTDPPDALAAAAEACENEGCWPVLVGSRGRADTMLASPIILPDYPVVAPESPGDLFDGGEIDEMLALHILALTDEEKAEMRATDPRTREILERTRNLDRESLLGLHGAVRDPSSGDPLPAEGDAPGARPNLAAGAPDAFWREMGRAPADEVVLDGVRLRRGSRVRLRPAPGGDVMDIALDGKVGIIEGIDEDDLGGIQFTVVVEGDPGLDLGLARMPGHRFFFRPEEVEPLPLRPRILVAGIGNVFLGDDGFGVEVARRFANRPLPDGVTVEDFGIRSLDLAYALAEYDVAVFVDATPRGGEPGTVYVIDASDVEPARTALETHGMDPVSVLAFARQVGPVPERLFVVGCEPGLVPDPTGEEIVGELSAPVEAAVEQAMMQVEALLARLTRPPAESGVAEWRSTGAEATRTG